MTWGPRLGALLGFSCAIGGSAGLALGVAERSRAGEDALEASSSAIARTREIDEVDLALCRGGAESLAIAKRKLHRLRRDARENQEGTTLEGAIQCFEEEACDRKAALRSVRDHYADRLGRDWSDAAARKDRGAWALLAGWAALFAASVPPLLAALVRKAPSAPSVLGDEASARPPLERDAMDRLFVDRLAELYDLKSRFSETDRFAAYGEIAAGLSHGLKTPLASIRAAAQVVEQRLDPGHPALVPVERIISEIDELTEQVQRFLRTGPPASASTAEVLKLEDLLAHLERVYAEEASKRGIAWVTRAECTANVGSSPALMEVALRNLAENALAAAPPGSTIRVELSEAPAPERAGLEGERPAGGRWCEIRIRDEGAGVPETVARGVSGVTTRPGGSGLGVAIARRIIGRHGGALSFDRSPAGTVARVALPVLLESSEA